jgi:hypothetical protein
MSLGAGTHQLPPAHYHQHIDARLANSRERRASEDNRPLSMMDGIQPTAPNGKRPRRKLVLCFDGTGNKFRGDDSDSNILKIFRCLDRTAGDQCMHLFPHRGNQSLCEVKREGT